MRPAKLLALLALVPACFAQFEPWEQPGAQAPYADADAEPNTGSEHESLDETADAFQAAADTHDVPADLLIALSAAATGHQMVLGEEEFEGQVPTVGVMALPEDHLDQAAALAGVDPDDAIHDRDANIHAAAALLSEWAEGSGIDRDELAAWAPVVARYSNIDDSNVQAWFVHDEVYEILRTGIDLEGVKLDPRKITADFPVPQEIRSAAGAERSYARWRPSPNHSARPGGASGKPSMVIIHTCEGSYSGCWGWLRNSRSKVSAHYVVDSTGSEVSQLVSEERKAWHIGAAYQCSRNGNTDCWRNGSSSNNFTIGIEHAGYASQSRWDPGLLAKSAKLTCDITKSHGIPRDAYHIVGHGQLQPYNRVDPGKNWPWTSYLADVRAECGGGGGGGGGSRSGTPAGTRLIDSNNAHNDTSNQRIEVSGNWKSSANVSGYYGTGYWWRTTGSSSDAASFWFKNSASTCYSVQAWWPAATDRSPAAPFVMVNADGSILDTVYVDQTGSHSRWVDLGAHEFDAGWSRVALSRWTDPGDVVIADALRLVPSTDCRGTSSPIEIVVDSDNRNNGTTARVEASGAWKAASATPGYYGTDYVWTDTRSVSDTFKYWFYLDKETKVHIETRWTAGSNRSTVAPFLVRNSSDAIVDRTSMDQTRNHGTWVGLGTWTLPAGWNRVELSRWAPEGKVVVADALRVRSAD